MIYWIQLIWYDVIVYLEDLLSNFCSILLWLLFCCRVCWQQVVLLLRIISFLSLLSRIISFLYLLPICWHIEYCICEGISLLHLMHVIAHPHPGTLATSLMRVKNSTCHFCLWHLLSGTLEWKKWKKDQKHQFSSG